MDGPKGSVLVLPVLNSMFRLGLVDMLVTHANIKWFGLTPLSGDRHGYMTPLLKTKTRRYFSILRRVTLISNFLEFYKAGSTTSRYVAMEIKTHFKFSRGQDNKNWELVLGLV